MGGLFGGGEPDVVKAPEVKKVAPPPTVDEDEIGKSVKKGKGKGFRDTFLVGDLVPDTDKKTFLG